jgi:hypothetical protein
MVQLSPTIVEAAVATGLSSSAAEVPRRWRFGSVFKQPAFKQALHVLAAIRDHENECRGPNDPIDQAVGLEDELAKLPDPELSQFGRNGAAIWQAL